MRRPSGSSASEGDRVVRGRLPGASAFGCSGSSTNICARVPKGKPSSGITGEVGTQAPLGVAQTRFPSVSAATSWVVSRRPSAAASACGSAGASRPAPPAASPRGASRSPGAARARPAADRPARDGPACRRPRAASRAGPSRSAGRHTRRRGPRRRASRTRPRCGARRRCRSPMAARSKPSSRRSCCRKTGPWLQGPHFQTRAPR